MAAALQLGALPGPPVLFRLAGLSPIVQGVYAAAADLCEVRTLPRRHETPARAFPDAAGFARAIEMRDFAFDPAFSGVAMVDFFLARLGLDPAAVPPALRRNAWLAPRVTPAPPPVEPGYALVCPRSSMALRDMPEPVHAAILSGLREAGFRVVTQGAMPPADSFAALCGLVAGAALVVSTDTAMPHLADAFGVPCLAMFTTHRPEWRIRDYPLARAVYLPAPGLPPSLEFARTPQDVAAAQAAWRPDGVGLAWLPPALATIVSLARAVD
jgi:hypothetical protein